MILALFTPALAQSSLDEVEAETTAIQDRVKESQEQLEALQKTLQNSKPRPITLKTAVVAPGYQIQSVAFYIDGRREPELIPGATVILPADATVTVRAVVQGSHEGFLSTFPFRMAASVPVTGLGAGSLQLVLDAPVGQRPSLKLTPVEAP